MTPEDEQELFRRLDRVDGRLKLIAGWLWPTLSAGIAWAAAAEMRSDGMPDRWRGLVAFAVFIGAWTLFNRAFDRDNEVSPKHRKARFTDGAIHRWTRRRTSRQDAERERSLTIIPERAHDLANATRGQRAASILGITFARIFWCATGAIVGVLILVLIWQLLFPPLMRLVIGK